MSRTALKSVPIWTRPHTSVLATVDAPEINARAAEQISRALEANHIVHFPRCPVPLPDAAALQHLRVSLPPLLPAGNVSFFPRGRKLLGLKAQAPVRQQTLAILEAHLQEVSAFLQRAIARQCEGWTVVKASFRPLQERGRNLKPHDSNELVHVDAGVHGSTNGDRILRFFVNLNEHEDRVWESRGTLQDLLDHHGIASGVLDRTGRLRLPIDKRTSDHARSLGVKTLALVNPLARQLDSSPYDRAMRQLHRYMKDSETFKGDERAHELIRFPPRSAWMAFTDGVSHACLSGRFALVSTFIIRRRALRDMHFSPYNLLAIRS